MSRALRHKQARTLSRTCAARAIRWCICVAAALACTGFAEEKNHILHVADFGAVPDDGQEDSAAIHSALDALAKSPGAMLVFSTGRYELGVGDAAPADRYFSLKEARDVTIDGRGATLLLQDPLKGLLRMDRCEGVRVENLTIDYKTPPFAAIEVESATESSFIGKSVGGHLAMDSPLYENQQRVWGYFLDGKHPGRLATGISNVLFAKSVSALGNGRFEVSFPNPELRKVEPGMIYCHIIRKNAATLFLLNASSRLHFENVTSFSSPAGYFVGADCTDITLTGCRTLIKPGWVKSGNGDAIHFQNSRGPIHIVDCVFEGISDDCVNLYSKPFRLLARENARRWRITADLAGERFLSRGGNGFLRAGDRLMALDRRDGSIHDGPRIEAMDHDGWAVLSEPWLEGFPDEDWSGFQIFCNELPSEVLIERCTFRNSRRFGIYLKASDTIIRDNRFEGMSGSAIYVANEPENYQEGPFAQRVRIEKNDIVDCGFDAQFLEKKSLETITFEAIRAHGVNIGDRQAFSDVSILGNTFHSPDARLRLSNIDKLTIRGNSFAGDAERERFVIEHVTGVSVDQ